jgi:putative membrane protein
MYYENYYYGMNVTWWVIWIVLMFWIFAIPYDIPGQRRKKESEYDILRKKYADGDITTIEYLEKKKNLEKAFKRTITK